VLPFASVIGPCLRKLCDEDTGNHDREYIRTNVRAKLTLDEGPKVHGGKLVDVEYVSSSDRFLRLRDDGCVEEVICVKSRAR